MIRFKEEALEKITGCGGDGPLKTSIHRVYPWTQIQDAQREMQDDKNRCVVMICHIKCEVLMWTPVAGRLLWRLYDSRSGFQFTCIRGACKITVLPMNQRYSDQTSLIVYPALGQIGYIYHILKVSELPSIYPTGRTED